MANTFTLLKNFFAKHIEIQFIFLYIFSIFLVQHNCLFNCKKERLMSEADSQRNKHSSLLWGVLGVLVCSMLLYEAFLYNRLLSAQWANAQYSARVALSNVRLKLALGLRLGIPLERYARAPLLVHEVSAVTGLPLALCNNMGDVLSIAGAFSAALLPQELAETRDMQVIEGEDGRLALLPLLAGPDDTIVGCVAAFLHRDSLERETRLLCLRNAALHMLVVLLGVGLLSLIARRRPELFAHSARNLALGTLLGVLLVCGSLSLYSFHQRYGENLLDNMDRTGLLLAQDFQRLTMADLPLENQAQSYLASVAANYNNAFSLTLLDAQGHAFASSEAEDVRNPFAQRTYALTLDANQEGPQLLLKAYLHWAPLWRNIREAGLDLLTLSVIAAIFMLELLLLQERRRSLAALHGTQTEHPALLLRPFIFFYVLGYDMTLALIPLRMGDLLPPTAAWRNMLMGLSVMAETAGIFLGIVLTRNLQKTMTPLKIALLGMTCIVLGSMLCMAAQKPWHFLIGIILNGFSYGGIVLLIQILTVGSGLLTDMDTGLNSGSICGVVLGAMLAERLGNAAIFGISSALGLLLLLVVWLVDRRHAPETQLSPLFQCLRQAFLPLASADAPKDTLSLRQVLGTLNQGTCAPFLVLAVLPIGIVVGGVLYFYLPVYMQGEGFSQGDIGRMYLLESFVIVCSSVYFGRLVAKSSTKGAYVALAVALGALGVICLSGLPPLAAAPLAAMSIGLCRSLSTPALSSHMLSLPIAKTLGLPSCMTILEFSHYAGSVLGPFAVSASLALASASAVLCSLGSLFLGMAFVFLSLERRNIKHSAMILSNFASYQGVTAHEKKKGMIHV